MFYGRLLIESRIIPATVYLIFDSGLTLLGKLAANKGALLDRTLSFVNMIVTNIAVCTLLDLVHAFIAGLTQKRES